MDWFLYDRDLRHEEVKKELKRTKNGKSLNEDFSRTLSDNKFNFFGFKNKSDWKEMAHLN